MTVEIFHNQSPRKKMGRTHNLLITSRTRIQQSPRGRRYGNMCLPDSTLIAQRKSWPIFSVNRIIRYCRLYWCVEKALIVLYGLAGWSGSLIFLKPEKPIFMLSCINIMSLNGCFHIGPVTGPRTVVLAWGLLFWPSASPRANTAIRRPIRLACNNTRTCNRGQCENIQFMTLL